MARVVFITASGRMQIDENVTETTLAVSEYETEPGNTLSLF